jgi:hypothetical protein
VKQALKLAAASLLICSEAQAGDRQDCIKSFDRLVAGRRRIFAAATSATRAALVFLLGIVAIGSVLLRKIRYVTVLLPMAALLLMAAGRVPDTEEPGVVGDLGEPTYFIFRGAATFSPEALAGALQSNVEFLLASRPEAPFGKFLSTLQQLMLRGYQHSGFADAKVDVKLDQKTKAIEVVVDEGPRYVAGDIEIAGAKALPIEAVLRRLTEPSPERLDTTGTATEPQEPIWKKGKPAPFDQPSIARLARDVTAALKDFGFFFTKLDVTVEPDRVRHTAKLRVAVLDEGPQGIIGDIVVTGNLRDRREDILGYLQLRPGLAFDQDVITKAKQKLWQSARYLNYEIEPELVNGPPPSVRLTINVTEFAGAPPLGGVLSETDQALLRFCSWMSGPVSRDDDTVIAVHLSLLRKFAVILSRQGALLALGSYNPSSNLEDHFAVLLTPDLINFISTSQHAKALAALGNGQLQIGLSVLPVPDPTPEHEFELTASAVFNTKVVREPTTAAETGMSKPLVRFDLLFAPVACLSFAHRVEWHQSRQGNVLTFDSGTGGRLSIDSLSGRLQEFVLPKSSGPRGASVRLEQGAFAAAKANMETVSADYPNRFDSRRPLDAMASFFVEEMLQDGPLALASLDRMGSEERSRAAAAVDHIFKYRILSPLDDAMSRLFTRYRDPFAIPPEMTGTSAEAELTNPLIVASAILVVANELFPRGSWPWTTARETAFVLSNQGQNTGEELRRLYESSQVGPIGYLTIAELLAEIKSPYAAMFAQLGLQRLSAADFEKDVALLLEGNSALAQCFRRLATAVRQLSEEDARALAAVFPPGAETSLLNASRLLHERPNDPIADVLPPAFDAYWEGSLRAQVERRLQELAVSADQVVP